MVPTSHDPPLILRGLGEIANDYDALLCDVWGVVHDGRSAHRPAMDALRRFRAAQGPVILLSNAPRPVEDLEEQFARLGVSDDFYDTILTSGVLAREELARRGAGRELPILHLGPERDRGVFAGLPIRCVDADKAEIVLCTGLFDDDIETPEDYRVMFTELVRHGLELFCVNPDIVVMRGSRLIYCAGALARLYDELGGKSVYFGKPHAPIYAAALAQSRRIAGRDDLRVLALGDGLETDIRGANTAEIDAVFIADGIHGEDVGEFTASAIATLCARSGVHAKGAMRALAW
jgi:HAD superfamily hydrolase (TIGR01459 family)